MPRPRRALALLALAAAAPLAADPAPDPSFDAVVKSHDALTRRYHHDTRVTGTVRIYAVEWKDGRGSSTLGADFDFEEVYDAAGTARGTITDARLDTRKTGTGSYVTPEFAYAVSRDKAGVAAVRDFTPRRDGEFDYLRRASVGPGGMPLSFDGRRSVALVSYVLAGKGNLTHTLALGPATRTTKFGKDVLAVPSTLTPKGGGGGVIRQTSYFDPANEYAFLGAESEEPPGPERSWASRQACVLEYEPRPGGPPAPKRFTRHVTPEKGDPLLEYEADYTRFEPYTPTADDFRLEARYGLTTPTGPDDRPRPAAPLAEESRWWVWAAAAAGVVLVGLAGVVVVRRRRTGGASRGA